MSTQDPTESTTRRVAFVVVRDGGRPEELAEAIGAPPDASRLRSNRVPAEATWEITARGSGSDDLTQLIESVMARARAVRTGLTAVCSDEHTTAILRVVQYVADDPLGPGFGISSEDVALLAELNAFVDVDQYWVGPNDI
jgi:hypothetical protein